MKNTTFSKILKWFVSLLIIAIYYWFALPPINIRSQEFWTFVTISIILFIVINAFSNFLNLFKGTTVEDNKLLKLPSFNLKNMNKTVKFTAVYLVAVLVLGLLFSVIGAQIFNAKKYNQLINITDGDFSKDVAEISMEQIPIVDRDTASRLAQRELGEMSDLVSQFEIQDLYTQINFKGKPVRVTPLVYGDIIKWFNNQKEGIPAYITIDMTTQKTNLVRLKEGLKYSESEYFMRDLNRALRFKYPTKIFDSISFEIDDDGTPYWVASTIKYQIGFWSGSDVEGVVLLNAVTGESKFYKVNEIPSWVDQAYDSDMILEQLNYNGKYRSGYLNSIFGQKGVLQTTEGYNYLAIGDDVYLYTGMTSVTSDESNVGFVLTNLRTKETKYYTCPGAEEYSAMSSAEGQVQNLKYTATFPLLLNISNRPTYFMSLKDSAGLVKMYAFVDVNQYQIVGTGNTVESAKEDYISKLKNENVPNVDEGETETITGKIKNISSAVVNGNTTYYILLDNNETIFTVSISYSDNLPFAKVGDTVTFEMLNEKIKTVTFS